MCLHIEKSMLVRTGVGLRVIMQLFSVTFSSHVVGRTSQCFQVFPRKHRHRKLFETGVAKAPRPSLPTSYAYARQNNQISLLHVQGTVFLPFFAFFYRILYSKIVFHVKPIKGSKQGLLSKGISEGEQGTFSVESTL